MGGVALIPLANDRGIRKEQGRWRVQISFNNRTRHIGCFDEIMDAVKARRQAESEFYGEFAPLGG